MKARNKTAVLMIGFILIVITLLLFYLLPEERQFIDWVGIGFIVLAEIVFSCSFIIIEKAAIKSEGTLLRSGGYSIISLYSFAALVISLLYMWLFREGIKYLLAIQLVLVAIAAILLILVVMSATHIAEKNKETLQAVSTMQVLLNKVIVLQNSEANKPYGQKLNLLYEAIRYCDNSASVPTDDLISSKISELEHMLESSLENKDDRVDETIDQILLFMKKRTTEVSSLKVGRI